MVGRGQRVQENPHGLNTTAPPKCAVGVRKRAHMHLLMLVINVLHVLVRHAKCSRPSQVRTVGAGPLAGRRAPPGRVPTRKMMVPFVSTERKPISRYR